MQPVDEHRQALHRERQWARVARTQLSHEAHQHHQVLSEVREGAARERRLHIVRH